jgi:serine/threonine protein kinase
VRYKRGVEGSPETFGSYVVYEQIGRGGMATVHRAERLGKDGSRTAVALKRLLPRIALRKDLVESFVHEARLLRYLDHPNIAATYDGGKIDGKYYIAMEYAPGPTLKELVEQCAATVNKLPIPITLRIALQICDALDHAHHRCDERGTPLGIIHRDISPGNIILSRSGLVKLIDFGLAKTTGSRAQTGEGMIKGKFNYVAPEYLGGTLDARADLWALGVVMYELLTSRRLFDGPDNFETMTRVRALPIPRPSRANPRVPQQLDAIVMTALERDPARRWQSAAALGDALRNVIAQPGNAFDTRQVTNWVEWVFTQRTGGKEASAIEDMFAVVAPPAPLTTAAPLPDVPPPTDASLRPNPMRWVVIALAVALLIALVLIAS